MPHDVAGKVQSRDGENFTLRPDQLPRTMNRDFQVRFTASLLTLLTAAAVVLAVINFRKEQEFQAPYDGAWWVERGANLVADRIEPNGPAERADVKLGDQLVAVDGRQVGTSAKLAREQYRVGPWAKSTYSVLRRGVPVDLQVILVPTDRSQYNWLR